MRSLIPKDAVPLRLAPEDRRKKKISKWKDTKESEGVNVLLFKVKSLASKRYIFKIDQNAQQFAESGNHVKYLSRRSR